MATTQKLTVTTDPPSITAGTRNGIVILHVQPADILSYEYRWEVTDSEGNSCDQALMTPTKDSAQVDIANFSPGRYEVIVIAKEIGGKKSHPLQGTGAFMIELDFVARAKESTVTEGDIVTLSVRPANLPPNKLVKLASQLDIFRDYQFSWLTDDSSIVESGIYQWEWDTTGLQPGSYEATVTASDSSGNILGERTTNPVIVKQRQIKKGDVLPVTMRRTATMPTNDQGLWASIRNRCEAISFPRYNDFMRAVFCEDKLDNVLESLKNDYVDKFGTNDAVALDARLSMNSVDAYNVLKLATEIFLLLESGVILKKHNTSTVLTTEDFFDESDEGNRINDNAIFSHIEAKLNKYLSGTNGKLPYFDRILNALIGIDQERREEKLPYCDGILQHRFSSPSLLELIWSYWHEEGMLVQTMNSIALRFQNRRGFADRDPLAELVVDPLRPLNNLLWGYIQNEHNRLTIPRRSYEYDSQYGLSLVGKAAPKLRSADSRSKFLEAFHNLLYRTSIFYREDADTTVIADAFPLLKAIREVHLILAEGAHNQFGDLPWTARIEMMIEQWLLARPEMQDFLRGRPMVPYREDWMGRVDAMKKLQGWTDTTITHFQELGMYGEQIILSIRYGDWIVVNNEDQAKNWARYWKPEIQGYIHGYRAATGVDLSSEPVDATPPWVHFKRQEERRQAKKR